MLIIYSYQKLKALAKLAMEKYIINLKSEDNFFLISFIFSQMKKKLKAMAHKAISKKVKKMGLKGEADRFIGNKMPKHLFSGKRGVGSTDRR